MKRQAVTETLTDGLVIVGLCLIVAGLWWVWPPVALIGAGAGCVALGVWRAM